MSSSRNKSDVRKLFEFWCEVKRTHGGDRSSTRSTVICESFPESFRDEKAVHDIATFAFPCDFECDSVQSFSFVLTTDDSKWRFGFCRHDPKTDSAMVIITYLPWHDTFLRLLTVLAELRRSEVEDDFRAFLAEAYNRGVPDPGGNLKLFYNGAQSYFVFERPLQFQLPSIPKNHNLNLYYNFVDPKNMIAVFAAMLAERRIIFTSRRLDRLSSCIQAANAFLYPMVWQHIFIPLLPMKLKDYLSAPMPYLIGVPEMVLETMTTDELGEVVTLNCDTKIFESPFDDVQEMPAEIVSQLKKQLSQSQEHIGDRVSKIFLGVLVQLIGGYRDAVEFRDSGKTFNCEKFIESRPSHLRPFLAKMMELQIFQQFIDERLEMLNTGLGFSDEFELETVRFAEKMKKRGRNYAFLKNVKDKTNPAVKSAVKSVKESSRGVKTAYKDLKSKFRDITPPNHAAHPGIVDTSHFRSHLSSNAQHDRIDGYVLGKSGGHHSAPSSPVFSKRVGGGLSAHCAGGFQYASPQAINGSVHAMQRRGPPPPLATSSSAVHIQSNGCPSAMLGLPHHNHHLASSPTVSPASSLCSSEMNLSQELQNHPLFKTPLVDRSSQHLQAASFGSLKEDPIHTDDDDDASTMNDLISLDDSNNASFDLEDFDPLNPNARPLPSLNKARDNRSKSTTLPPGTSASLITSSSTSKSISNPLYPYFTPRQTAFQGARLPLKPPSTKPPPLPTSMPPPMPPPNEDDVLLRKYGLDQFTLTAPSPPPVELGAGSKPNATATAGGMSTWTTFD